MEARAKLFGHPVHQILIVSRLGLLGELVGRLGVGVDDGAHLDTPSSLSGPASGSAR